MLTWRSTTLEPALIRVWINEGANWPEDFVFEEASEEAAAPPPAAAPKTLTDRLWVAQGFLHPATVHFPIALFVVGAVFVVLGWKWPSIGTQIPLACLLLGAPTAIASTAMGFSFATEEGYGSWMKIDMDSEVFWHRWSGVIVTVTSAILAVVALLGIKKQSQKMERSWKIGLLLVGGMVGAVGHQGGELSYGTDFYPRAFRILLGTDGEAAEAEAVDVEPAAAGEEAAVAAAMHQDATG